MDDVDFHRHSYPQWRIAWQQQIDTKGLSRGIALWRDLRDRGPQSLRGKGLGSQECLLPHGNPGDFFLVYFSHHLHRRRRAYPKQYIGWPDDLTDLAIAAQHHAIQWRAKHE